MHIRRLCILHCRAGLLRRLSAVRARTPTKPCSCSSCGSSATREVKDDDLSPVTWMASPPESAATAAADVGRCR